MILGLHTAVDYYYYPGFHEPGAAQMLGVNRRVWDGLSTSDRQLIETACAAEYSWSMAEFNAKNAIGLRKLRDEGKVKIQSFGEPLLRAFHEVSREVVADAGAADEITRRIYSSHQRFRESIMDWSDVAERAFMNARRLV
jgi:TRAP-type mannitol/chloroaromatic compound transport system substrate-binding protein